MELQEGEFTIEFELQTKFVSETGSCPIRLHRTYDNQCNYEGNMDN